MNLGQELLELAATWKNWDPYFSSQLGTLGQAINSNQLTRWYSVDIFRVFDLDAFETRLADRFCRFRIARSGLEIICHCLALLLITITGVALWIAAYNYQQIDTQITFFSLWAHGFENGGIVKIPLFTTLGQLIVVDTVLLVWSSGMSFVLRKWSAFEEKRALKLARDQRCYIQQFLGQVDLLLSSGRYTQNEQNLRQFQTDTQALLKHMEYERSRLDEFTNRRENEIEQLNTFITSWTTSIEDLLQFAHSIKDTYKVFDTSVNRLLEQVEKISSQQSNIETVMKETNEGLWSMTDSLAKVLNTIQVSTKGMNAAMKMATESALRTFGYFQELGILTSEFSQDPVELHKSLLMERKTLLDTTQRLQVTVGDFGEITQHLDAALARMQNIEKSISATMHLSAQIVDDHEQRTEQAYDLTTNLVQISDCISRAVDQFSKQNTLTRELLDRLSNEGERLS